MRIKDRTSKRYGRLVGIKFLRIEKRRAVWLFKCDCGRFVEKDTHHLINKNVSCGCFVLENINKVSHGNVLPDNLSAKNRLFRSYKWGSKDRNLMFDLSFDEFVDIVTSKCDYCGAMPKQTIKEPGGTLIYNGIDRIDNKGGYVSDNVVPCCGSCNQMKGKRNREEFLNQVKRIYIGNNHLKYSFVIGRFQCIPPHQGHLSIFNILLY